MKSLFDHVHELVDTLAAPYSALPEVDLDWDTERALFFAQHTPAEPLRLRRNSGRREPGDRGWGGSTAIVLISPRFVAALRYAGCTGWSTYPVEIVGGEAPGFAGLAVTGRCGPIDADTYGRDAADPPWRVGIGFDPASWDGSDVFAPYPRTKTLLSDRARKALEVARLKNVGFERLSEARYLAGDYS